MTEVHWCIIANLGFKFRSHFTAARCAACGRRAARRAACATVLLVGRLSRAMLASARSLVVAVFHLFPVS